VSAATRQASRRVYILLLYECRRCTALTRTLPCRRRLNGGGVEVACDMCTAVYRHELPKLRLLLRAGAPPDACDYDKRSPLHIAGAEGNLTAVKLMIQEGSADPEFKVRRG
jgi:hypothetical protein